MKRMIFSGMLLWFSVASYAQGTNMNKTSASGSESSVVEVQAVAIPAERMHLVEIDPENYHKAVNSGTVGAEPVQEVSITTTAVKNNIYAEPVKKTAVENSNGKLLKGRPAKEEKKAEVRAPATKR